MKLVLIALACTLAATTASLQPGLRGICVYSYDESFTGSDLHVSQVDSKLVAKLIATKEFVSNPKPINSALDFLGLLDGRCDVSLKCEKKECAKPVETTCPAKVPCPSCESCAICPAAKTCGPDPTTTKPVITTTPKVVITTQPKILTTTPKPVTTTTPKPRPTTTTKPVITTTTQESRTYLPPVPTEAPKFLCTEDLVGVDPRCPCLPSSRNARCAPPPPGFECTDKLVGNDPRCPCRAGSKLPQCQPPPPPPPPPAFKCTDALIGVEPRCPCPPGSKLPKCYTPPPPPPPPTVPPFKCTEALYNIDPRCPCPAGSKLKQCAPPPPDFKCTDALVTKDPRCPCPPKSKLPQCFMCTEDLVGLDKRCPCEAGSRNPRCVKVTTTKPPVTPPRPVITTTKFKGPTYIPQNTLFPETTREPWTQTYVINTGTFRQSHTWEPFVAKGTWSPRPTRSYGTVTTTPKYVKGAGAFIDNHF